MPRRPRSERWLERRDARRDIGAELLESVRLIKAGVIGKVYRIPVTAPGATKGVLANAHPDLCSTEDESLEGSHG